MNRLFSKSWLDFAIILIVKSNNKLPPNKYLYNLFIISRISEYFNLYLFIYLLGLTINIDFKTF